MAQDKGVMSQFWKSFKGKRASEPGSADASNPGVTGSPATPTAFVEGDGHPDPIDDRHDRGLSSSLPDRVSGDQAELAGQGVTSSDDGVNEAEGLAPVGADVDTAADPGRTSTRQDSDINPADPPAAQSSIEGEARNTLIQCYVDAVINIQQPAGLLVSGWVADRTGAAVSARLSVVDREVADYSWAFRYPRRDVATYFGAEAEPDDLYGFAIFFPIRDLSDSTEAELLIESATGKHRITVGFSAGPNPVYAIAALQGLWHLARNDLLARFGGIPAEVMTAVVGAMPEGSKVHVDQCLPVIGTGFFLSGWYLDNDKSQTAVYFVDENLLISKRIDHHWVRTTRPDVVEAMKDVGPVSRHAGFSALVPVLPSDNLSSLALYFVSDDTVGRWPLIPTDIDASRGGLERLFGALANNLQDADKAMAIVGPVVESITVAPIKSADTHDGPVWFGAKVAQPITTIIIPLWRTIEVLKYQLASIALAAQTQAIEVLLALDDIDLEEQIIAGSDDWLARYGVPFGLINAGRHLGFLQQINRAAAQARGQFLLLMHSDVLPDQADWLDRMLKPLSAHPRCGIVGPKLLYEDGSVDSNGLRFSRVKAMDRMIDIDAIDRGVPDHDPRRTPYTVDAVPSPSFLIRRSLFESLGGPDSGYLLEYEFAFADLCARAQQIGYICLLEPSVTMRHLSGLSWNAFANEEPFLADPKWRRKVHLYNCWRQAKRLALAGGRAS